MLYRSLLVVACLLSTASVASADGLDRCLSRVREVTGGSGTVKLNAECKRQYQWELDARAAEYRARGEARRIEVERKQRARNPWF